MIAGWRSSVAGELHQAAAVQISWKRRGREEGEERRGEIGTIKRFFMTAGGMINTTLRCPAVSRCQLVKGAD